MAKKKWIVDTDIWIEYFHNRHGIKEKIETLNFSDLYVSEITIAELYYGALHGKNVKKHIEETNVLQDTFAVLPISKVLMDYAELRQHLSEQGLTVDYFDLLIAATARHYDLTLVTHNVKHFSKLKDIKIEDWCTES